jgi:hypothetical protein
MRATKTKTWTTTSPAPAVFAALQGVVESGKYTLVAQDDANRRLAFTGARSALSWGTEYVAEVTESGGQTRLELVCGGHDDSPKALADGWKHGKAADKLLAAVAAAVDGS